MFDKKSAHQNLVRLYSLTREELAEVVEESVSLMASDDSETFPNKDAWEALPAQIRAGAASLPFPATLLSSPAAWVNKTP